MSAPKKKPRVITSAAANATTSSSAAANEPILRPLQSLEQWKQKHFSGQPGISPEILNPFWRSIALNPYEFFTEDSIERQLRAKMLQWFGERNAQKKKIYYLLDLRMSFTHRPEQTAKLLNTYVFSDAQLARVPDDHPCAIVKMTIIPKEESVHALQLRTPTLPIGSMARYNAAYTESGYSSVSQRRAASKRPTDINYAKYSQQELEESDLLNRYIKRGAYLYEELRDREPVTLAYLVAERRMKELQLLEQEQQKAKQALQNKSKKSSKPASSSAAASSGIDDDNDDVDDGVSLSSEDDKEEEEEAVETDSGDESFSASVEFSTSNKSVDNNDDDAMSERSIDISISSSSSDRAADAGSSKSEDLEEEAVRQPVVVAGKKMDADDDDDDYSAPLTNRFNARRHAAPHTPPVVPSKRKELEDPTQPFKINLKRADEFEWLQLVVASNSYLLSIDIASLVPSKATLLTYSRCLTVGIEVGVSVLPEIMGKEDDETEMVFYTTNAAHLENMLKTDVEARQNSLLPTLVNVQTSAPLKEQQTAAEASGKEVFVEPQVSITSLLSPEFHDDAEVDILPIRDSNIDHPLNDYRRFVDANNLTLYEINCYSSQRLAVLMLAYQAYYVETEDAKRQPLIEALIQSQYPVHSGATYHLVHSFKGASKRQLMHEGIGLAMLCFCAKHNSALCESLILMEMCYLKHKQEMKAKEFYTSHQNDDDNDEEDDDTSELQRRIAEHSHTILNYIDGCTDVLAIDLQSESLENQEDAGPYVEFFAILRDLINDWTSALKEIEDNRSHVPDIDATEAYEDEHD